MRTCRRSNRKARHCLALAAILLGTSAVAQDSPVPRNARERASQEGAATMDRLRDAIGARRDDAAAEGPQSLPALRDAQRLRAFEALKKRTPSPEMAARARTALAKGKEAMSAERAEMARRLGQALGLEAPDVTAIAGVAAPAASKDRVAVLFVSSSIPVAVLRTYAAQIERAGGVMAFRGMPGGLGKVGPMARLSAEILRLDPGCEGPACAMRNVQLIVDPLVFRQHGISRVPALAMIPGDPTQPYCEREDDSPRSSHVIYGDAALSGLLEEYARLGGKEEVRDAQARLERR